MLDGLDSLVEELSNESPAPGGGSAAAICGALAASLGTMVTKIILKNEQYKEGWPEAERLKNELSSLAREFKELSLQDAQAYLEVIQEAKRKKKGEPNKLEAAERRAALIPLRTCARALELLKLLRDVEVLRARATVSDLFVALMLAKAAFFGGKANVFINLTALDPASVKDLKAKVEIWEAEFEGIFKILESKISGQLGFEME